MVFLCRALTGLVIALISTIILMVTGEPMTSLQKNIIFGLSIGYAVQLEFFLNTNFLINFRKQILRYYISVFVFICCPIFSLQFCSSSTAPA